MRRKERKRVKKRALFILALAIVSFFILCLVCLFRGRYWDGVHSLNLAVNGQNEVYIINFNPESGEITKLIIPGDTKMELTGNLGIMKVKNIWQLGQNEKLGGSLMVNTLTKNLKLATYTWVNDQTGSFWDLGLGSFARVVFSKYDTNLSFGDRFRMALFSKKVKTYKKEEYVLGGRIPRAVSVLANDLRLSEDLLKVKIINLTGNKVVAEEFSKIIESLGAKVSLIEESGEEDGDCVIYSDSREVGKFLKYTFNCKEVKKLKDSNFDIEVSIGKAFSKRF